MHFSFVHADFPNQKDFAKKKVCITVIKVQLPPTSKDHNIDQICQGVAFRFKKAKYMIHFLLRTFIQIFNRVGASKSVKVVIICWDFCLPNPLNSYSSSSEKYCSWEVRGNQWATFRLAVFNILYRNAFRHCIWLRIILYLWGSALLLLSVYEVKSLVCHIYQHALSNWELVYDAFFSLIIKRTKEQQHISVVGWLVGPGPEVALPKLSEWILYN